MIYIIIPVHNRLSLTKQCLDSLKRQSFSDFSVIVIDDGSTDGTSDWLHKNAPDVTVLEGDGQLWWTGAVRNGVEYIQSIADNESHIMTLNNDIVLSADAIEILYQDSNKSNAISGAISVDLSTDKVISSGAVVRSWFFNINRHPFRGLKKQDVHSAVVDVSMLTGRAVLYPIEVFNKTGNFNSKSLPHYGGDIEMTVRAMKAGYKLHIVADAVVLVERETTGLNSDDRRLSLFDKFRALFSIKSANNLHYRTILAIKIAPWYALPTYLIVSYIKILSSLFVRPTSP